MLTVRGQQHSFSTHERVFLWKCQRFWDRICLDLSELKSFLVADKNTNMLYDKTTTYVLVMQGAKASAVMELT